VQHVSSAFLEARWSQVARHVHSKSISDILDISRGQGTLPRPDQETCLTGSIQRTGANQAQNRPRVSEKEKSQNWNAVCGKKEDNIEHRRENVRKYSKKRYAEDPIFKLRCFMLDCVRHRAWFREDLPWKSHVPLWYEEKVINTCSRCTVTRHGGGRLW
jgi:hypothetical protein